MKLMHMSDLHIGKKLFETSMLEDQRYIFEPDSRSAGR